ncbi:MAG: hypothetical protein L3K04_00490 [Thermoplasmata archaeon]|nr:hypothetical protein [Thermoplasmata archaeon]MCI4340905.1 hypothetical protein [Thermoplasmata archaeon]
MVGVVLFGGSRDSRAALQGLLRMHHHEVMGEADSPSALGAVPSGRTPSVLLIDGTTGGWTDIVARARARWPSADVVLLQPRGQPVPPADEGAPRRTRVLSRPFRTEEFAQAIDGDTSRSGARREAAVVSEPPP